MKRSQKIRRMVGRTKRRGAAAPAPAGGGSLRTLTDAAVLALRATIAAGDDRELARLMPLRTAREQAFARQVIGDLCDELLQARATLRMVAYAAQSGCEPGLLGERAGATATTDGDGGDGPLQRARLALVASAGAAGVWYQAVAQNACEMVPDARARSGSATKTRSERKARRT